MLAAILIPNASMFENR